MHRTAAFLCASVLASSLMAQGKLPDVSSTIKGDLNLPIPFKNPLFTNYTENIGQAGLAFQVPVLKGMSIGAGGAMWWTTLKQRTLQPFVPNGDVRRTIAYGKLAYERYTGSNTFYEASLRLGLAWYDFDCGTCVGARDGVAYWALGMGYFVHATENLAFGLTLGYDQSSRTFLAEDLGQQRFPGSPQSAERRPMRNVLVGLGFSTRLRRSEREAVTW
ncbi:MAG: hypothetical protein IPF41_07125 [Flavobacteriales bacterium]|nr:hypothetical protein [Flavobacteriales bacterium]